MATTVKRLVNGSQLTASAATYYTAGANTKAVIKAASLVNTTAGAVTATVYLISSGGTAGATNTLISAKSIAAGETYNCPELVNHVLEAAGFIQALAGSATAITLVVSGVEVT
jgi:hypothetical protein